MAGLGAPELMIILVIILLVFGGAKLPKLAKSLGEARREFEKGTEEEEAEARRKAAAKELPATPPLTKDEELLRREAELSRREAELKRLDEESR